MSPVRGDVLNPGTYTCLNPKVKALNPKHQKGPSLVASAAPGSRAPPATPQKMAIKNITNANRLELDVGNHSKFHLRVAF